MASDPIELESGDRQDRWPVLPFRQPQPEPDTPQPSQDQLRKAAPAPPVDGDEIDPEDWPPPAA